MTMFNVPEIHSGLRNVVQLDYTDQDGTVTVTPSDQDRFNIKITHAVEILKHAGDQKMFLMQFDFLIKRLIAWIRGQENIDQAFVTLRDGGLVFVVMCQSPQYDEDFEDALSDLDIDLANDDALTQIKIDVMSLPNVSEEAMGSFLGENVIARLVKKAEDA